MSAPTTQIISAATIRQEFEDPVRWDLLGPAGGEQEIVTEQSIRNRYLLGMLATCTGCSRLKWKCAAGFPDGLDKAMSRFAARGPDE